MHSSIYWGKACWQSQNWILSANAKYSIWFWK